MVHRLSNPTPAAWADRMHAMAISTTSEIGRVVSTNAKLVHENAVLKQEKSQLTFAMEDLEMLEETAKTIEDLLAKFVPCSRQESDRGYRLALQITAVLEEEKKGWEAKGAAVAAKAEEKIKELETAAAKTAKRIGELEAALETEKKRDVKVVEDGSLEEATKRVKDLKSLLEKEKKASKVKEAAHKEEVKALQVKSINTVKEVLEEFKAREQDLNLVKESQAKEIRKYLSELADANKAYNKRDQECKEMTRCVTAQNKQLILLQDTLEKKVNHAASIIMEKDKDVEKLHQRIVTLESTNKALKAKLAVSVSEAVAQKNMEIAGLEAQLKAARDTVSAVYQQSIDLHVEHGKELEHCYHQVKAMEEEKEKQTARHTAKVADLEKQIQDLIATADRLNADAANPKEEEETEATQPEEVLRLKRRNALLKENVNGMLARQKEIHLAEIKALVSRMQTREEEIRKVVDRSGSVCEVEHMVVADAAILVMRHFVEVCFRFFIGNLK